MDRGGSGAVSGGWRITWLVFALWLGGCAGPARVPDAALLDDPRPLDERRQALLRQADGLVGTPYRYGGADRRGFDCSGLVLYVHRAIGIAVPRTAAAQWRQARKVPVTGLRAGDLLFFRIDRGKGDHIAIYAGGGRFIHAPSGGKAVARANLADPYWRGQLVGAGSYL